MILKKASVIGCMVLGLSAVQVRPAAAYPITDPSQLGQVVANLVQMISAVSKIQEMVGKAQEILTSVGDIQKGATSTVEDLVSKAENSLAAPSFEEGLQGIGLSSAAEKADQSQPIIASNLLPPSSEEDKKTETIDETMKRHELQDEAYRNALADAYAASLAYSTTASKADSEQIQPLMSSVQGTEDLIAKADANATTVMAEVQEVREGNKLLAEYLKLLAASEIRNMD